MGWDESGRVGTGMKLYETAAGPWERATTRHSSTLMPMPERGNKKVGDFVTRSFVKHSNVTLPDPTSWRSPAAPGVPAAEYQKIIQIRHRRLKMYINRLSCWDEWPETDSSPNNNRRDLYRSSFKYMRRILDPQKLLGMCFTNDNFIFESRCHRTLEMCLWRCR